MGRRMRRVQSHGPSHWSFSWVLFCPRGHNPWLAYGPMRSQWGVPWDGSSPVGRPTGKLMGCNANHGILNTGCIESHEFLRGASHKPIVIPWAVPTGRVLCHETQSMGYVTSHTSLMERLMGRVQSRGMSHGSLPWGAFCPMGHNPWVALRPVRFTMGRPMGWAVFHAPFPLDLFCPMGHNPRISLRPIISLMGRPMRRVQSHGTSRESCRWGAGVDPWLA